MYSRSSARKAEAVIGLLIVAVWASIKFYFQHPFLSILIMIACVFIGQFLLEFDYRRSVTRVKKGFVKGKNIIANTHCTIKYETNKQIIIMENIPDRRNKKRMLTIEKSGNYNINKKWSMICSNFDTHSNFDTMVFLIDGDSDDIIELNSGPARIDAPEDSNPATSSENETGADGVEEGSKKTVIDDKYGDSFGTYDVEKIYGKKFDGEEVFVDLGEIMERTSKRLNVNVATSSEIAVLPGINIVKAKKIVEYRDTHGLFESEEDFLKVANVKEHFCEKIRNLIVAGAAEIAQTNEEVDEGRIIDF